MSRPSRPVPAAVASETPTGDELATFQRLTLGLVGVALRSLDAIRGELSLHQLRLLLIVAERGRPRCSEVADALAVSASAVTHAADRLVDAGYLERVADPANRRVVELGLTGAGDDLVDSVLAWRRAELGRVLGRLDPGERTEVLHGLSRFTTALTEPA